MRGATIFSLVSLLASGCASTTWQIDRGYHSIDRIAVAVEADGDASVSLAEWRRAVLVANLRARGCDVRDAAPGVPLLQIRLGGHEVVDGAKAGPDVRVVAYHVEMKLSQGEHVVASGSAEADGDPAPALRALALRLFRDVSPGPSSSSQTAIAARWVDAPSL